ncbi:MAG: type II toxin-antitoxin system VapC family toxin [Caulobacterales bacterium]
MSAMLVDTHLLLWAAGEPDKLPPKARILLEAADTQLLFSAASLWEVAIKHQLGREDFKVDPRRLRRGLLDNDWRELAITSEHAVATNALPAIHNDPFDRMLIAQSHVEGIALITSDDVMARYPGAITKV